MFKNFEQLKKHICTMGHNAWENESNDRDLAECKDVDELATVLSKIFAGKQYKHAWDAVQWILYSMVKDLSQ